MGFVYFIQSENGHVKIGSSANPDERLRQLQTASSFQLNIVGVIESENYKTVEKNLHKTYKSSRIQGEWFDITKEEVNILLSSLEKVPLKEVTSQSSDIHDLISVQFLGTFQIPNNRYDHIAIVSFSEHSKKSLFVTDVMIGKGFQQNSQYEVDSIPSDWVLLNGLRAIK